MEPVLRSDYWNDAKARAAFKKFILGIHGLDFTEWEAHGYWDTAYRPFSLFHGDEIVSSVCLYELNAWIDGKPAHLGQFSGVGTLPDWRRRGLARRLSETALENAGARLDGIYLFADEEAIPFYESTGFRALDNSLEFVEPALARRREGARRLDPAEKGDLDHIFDNAGRRAPVSDRYSVLSPKLLIFHVLYLLRDAVWEIPALDCLILARRKKGVLEIFDILAERVPKFEEFYPYLADPGDKEVRFHFHADKLGLPRRGMRLLKEMHCYVRGDFPVARPVFPFTSRA